jgi:hypothetical protein
MASQRGYASSKFLIELDGKPAGYVKAASGGQPIGRVVDEAPGTGGLIKKHLDGFDWDPIVLQVSIGVTEAMYDWIAAMPAGKQKAHSGAVVMVDQQNKQVGRLDWTDGLITQLVFPGVDAAARDAATISVTIQPLTVKFDRSAGGMPQVSYFHAHPNTRLLGSSFKVLLSGLPVFSPRVSKVGSITVRQDFTRGDEEIKTGPLHIDDIEVTGAHAQSDEIWRWLDDFVIGGNNADKNERSLDLDLLSTNLKDVLVSLKLGGVGIVTLADMRDDQGGRTQGHVMARLYAEELAVTFDKTIFASVATTPAATTQPAAGATSTGTAPTGLTAEAFLGFWAAGSRIARPRLTAEAVASRLMATAEAAPEDILVDTREAEGRRFGEMWAREIGSREELEAMTELSATEWSTVTLTEDHSLLWALHQAGETADPDVVTLTDDSFVRGVVAGATSVRREIEPHLEG